MSDGTEKPIELIRPGDMVASFDVTADGGRGALVGKRVVRTFVSENLIVIDFHGTKITPGHAYLCGDGPHEGRFKQIMNIVRADGAVVLADGSLMRAATGLAVGSPGDAFLEVQIAHPARHKRTGKSVTLLKERGRIRAGTRVQRPDGSFFSFLDLIEANGWTLHEDGLVSQGFGHAPEPLLWAGPTIPKPEDYILARSRLTLADLYDDPRQADGPNGALFHRPGQGEANAVVLETMAPGQGTHDHAEGRSGRSIMRRARDLLGAKPRKPSRAPKQAGETVH